MKNDKEILNKYITAIRSVIDSNLIKSDELQKLVESIIFNIPKLSESLGLNNSYDIREDMLVEAVKYITGRFDEFEVVNAFSEYSSDLVIDYRVISWMRNYIETFLPVEEIQKIIIDKNHADFIFDKAHDFSIMYDTNINTDEFDFIEFIDANNQEVDLNSMDLDYFSSKSFGMFLELDRYAMDIDTGNFYNFENGVLQVFYNSKYIPVNKVMTAAEISELFSHRFKTSEEDLAYGD